jgi:hypothetical protein
MHLPARRNRWLIFIPALLTAWSAGAGAQKPAVAARQADASGLPERIWHDPGDVAALDMINGVGGKAHAPDPSEAFAFVKEVSAPVTEKFDIVDARGVTWRVKLGDESQPETAASRFMWAAGYFTDEDYYVAKLRVTGLPKLRHGQNQVSKDGTVSGARLERQRDPATKLGEWDWFDNPFVGGREFNGLRVMMALLNSWDLKAVNNAVFVVNGERQYIMRDLGGTFGRTGNALMRTKGRPKDYEDSTFVRTMTPDFIDFVLHSRPQFLGVLDLVNYRERTRMENIAKHIPRADVKWLAARLSKLSNRQIQDAFRAAGFDSTQAELLTRTLQMRIAALGAM